MPIIYLYLILFFFSLFFAGLFAFLETSFTALRLFRIKELRISVARYKSLFDSWEKNPQRILITILIANNFAHVLSSVLITEVMQTIFGNIGLVIGVPVATIMILIFGEILPKTFAKSHHGRAFTSSLFVINILYKMFYPLVSGLLGMTRFFLSRVGRPDLLESQEAISEKEIKFLIDYSDQKGLMATEKSEMLHNVFELGQTLVKEILVPKVDVKILSISSSLHDAMEMFSKYRYSRLPIFDGKEDNIVGMIYQKDIFELVYKDKKKTIKEVMRPIPFVPETKIINQLLSDFLKKRQHMAIVLDEYGAIVGIVTLEDVIEEIVGEIRDEHEKICTEIVSLPDGSWVIDAGVSLDKVEELLGIYFEVEDSVSLGGFLTEELQHLPKVDDQVTYEGYFFKVKQATSRRVLQVQVSKALNGSLEKNSDK